MFGSSILEAAIALIFVYLLLSLMCTALNEGIASLIQKRGKNLFEGIKNLLNDPTFTGLAQQVYNHGLIGGISQNAANPRKPTRLPSYMSSENFSLALLDILGTRGIISTEYGDLLAAAAGGARPGNQCATQFRRASGGPQAPDDCRHGSAPGRRRSSEYCSPCVFDSVAPGQHHRFLRESGG